MDLLKIIEGIRTPVGDAFFTFLANAINEYVLIVIALVILWCVNKTKGYYVMMLTFLGMLCNQFMKIAFRIPRPWVLDPEFNPVAAAKPSATPPRRNDVRRSFRMNVASIKVNIGVVLHTTAASTGLV